MFVCSFWIEIKHKARHYQGENSSNFIHKMYQEKIIKKKIVNLQMREKQVLKQLFGVLNF